MATTVGFIKAIGVKTVITPTMTAVLEENIGMKVLLEKGLTFLAKLEEKFTIKGRIKK